MSRTACFFQDSGRRHGNLKKLLYPNRRRHYDVPMTVAVDVAVMTYNSERYLARALRGLFNAVEVNDLYGVDHNSTDATRAILDSFGAEVVTENVGLGYARQVALGLVQTPIFMFLDSDIVFSEPYDWYARVIDLLNGDAGLAAVVMCLPLDPDDLTDEYQQYTQFWNKRQPWTVRWGFTTGSTFIKREAVRGLKIPPLLDAREDRYMELYIRNKRHMRFINLQCCGTHFFDYRRDKGAWCAANERLLTGLHYFGYNFLRHVATAPLKAIPPMFHFRNPKILAWNTRYWCNYLEGYLRPEKYRKLVRCPTG